jgi:hypothetical protein
VPKTDYIHIAWDGPYLISQLSHLQDDTKDYGVYQIYGGHPIYGSDVLLYIGKADQQTFGTRIGQENWIWNLDSGRVQIYVGRLSGHRTPDLEGWSAEIAKAEKLLIYSHVPACNSQFINLREDNDLEDVHVMNWGNHRDLMPEASGRRWTRKYYSELYEEYTL